MVQEDVAGRDRFEDSGGLPDPCRESGRERLVLEVRPVDEVRQRHQPMQVHRAVDAEHHSIGELELAHQIVDHLAGTDVRHLEADLVAVAPGGQLADQRAHQVVDVLGIDEELAVSGDAKLVARGQLHAREQIPDPRVDDGGEEHEVELAVAYLGGQPDEPRQRPRRLDHRHPAGLPERVLAGQRDDEVEALVQYRRKRVDRVEPDRGHDREELLGEIACDPPVLRVAPFAAAQESNPLPFEGREDGAIQQIVLLADQSVRIDADTAQGFARRQAVRGAVRRPVLDLVEYSRHPYLEELVEVGAGDAQEPEPFEERGGGIARLFKTPAG